MADCSIYAFSAIFSKSFGTFAEGSCCINDIINNEAVSVFYVADDVHDFSNARFRTSLFNDGDRSTYTVSQFSGSCYAAKVRRNDGQVFQILGFYIICQKRCGHQMIDRNIEEALDLSCMKVHRYNSCHAGSGHEIGNQLGADRFTASCLAVLTSISIIWNNNSDVACRSSLERINHNQHFHQVIINRSTSRLNDKAVLTTDAFINHDLYFSIIEAAADCFTERDSNVVRNFLCQSQMRGTRKNLQFRSVFHVHLLILPFLSHR